MILKNIISTITLFAVCLLSIAGAFISFIPQVGAQADSFEHLLCPIVGDISVSFGDSEESYQVEDSFSQTVEIQNNSAYTLGGVRVVIAAYHSSVDTVPAYWMFLPDEYQLMPGSPIEINIETDLSILPAGQYVLKVFATQGDETAMLGAVVRDVEYTDGITIIKSSPQTNLVEISVKLNGEYFTGETIVIDENAPIEAKLITRNNNKYSFTGSSMLGVITQGKVPLGTAVRKDELSLVTLVPETVISNPITDNFIERGPFYTVYAGLVSPGSLSPVMAVPVQVADYEINGSWSYISKVGLSSYPLHKDSEIIVCVDSIGANRETGFFQETLATELIVSDEGKEVFSEKLLSDETGNKNYFTFTPKMSLKNFTLSTNLFQQRFNSEIIVEREGSDARDQILETLFVVDTISLSLNCDNGEVCLSSIAPPVTISHEQIPFKNSFWFYAGIMLAAALLLYIMLRRLDTQESDNVSEVTPDELQ